MADMAINIFEPPSFLADNPSTDIVQVERISMFSEEHGFTSNRDIS